MNEAKGEAILAQAVAAAQDTWGARLLAAYALGSLAHGGFSDLVSDVDLGLVLADPLEATDSERVAALGARVKAGGAPLAERLSVFWGTPSTLRERAEGGRFPPLDRLDLIRYGRLLAGSDARDDLPLPDRRALVLAAAAQALRSLGQPAAIAELKDPEGLLAAGVRPLTKRILFPVRFLYTARTGEIGRNHDAVAHLITVEPPPIADLGAAALRWREAAPSTDEALPLVRAGILPLYRRFVEDHAQRLRDYGEPALAADYDAWRAALAGD